MTEPPPHEGRLAAAANVVKGLSLGNVLIIALLVVIAIPAYLTYKALNDPVVMDRLMSSYREYPNQISGCTLREVKERGGPDMWSVSAGFAFHGSARWYIAVGLTAKPSDAEITTHCETLKRIADGLLRSTAP
jgi:hypothetical protein